MTTTSSFPSEKTTLSYWMGEADRPLAKHRSTEELPEEVDILIIGSGLSGAGAAFNLLVEYGTDKSVMLLEARDVCSGATGRNGGHMRSYYYLKQDEYVKNFGEEVAADLCMFEHYELDKIEELTKKYDIDYNFKRRRAFHAYEDEEAAATGQRDYDAFVKNPFIPQDVKDSVNVVYGEEAQKEYNTVKLGGFTPASSLWPYKLVTGLLKVALEKGLNLQTNTPVRELDLLEDKTWLVKTPRGSVRAKKVIATTNAYTRAILPEFNDKITPLKGVVSHLKSESGKSLDVNMIHLFSGEDDYISVCHDGSLIIGGGGETYEESPNKEMMVDCLDDSFFPDETGKYFVDYPTRNYKSLANEKFVNDYTWTGCRGYSYDEFPFVGDLSEFGRPNLYVSAGFSGHGMPRVFSCAAYVSELAIGKNPTVKVPAPFKVSAERMNKE
ncbi:hypothetical protein OGAPHI_005389 [Ogataea philodendri]|uniref:FAD dependent oxidoreductase domain-containing protein n=1 Tax=Ogataea philodendri TaxID=1378263 RepID=A0A9P8P1K2_9ASCO|nr:uncharacterized protein OGAPHI_005389 [Ogataea philodendri]KAH3663399.1 hypothetical protein OGAPHI_005389 [Ogataea philodendri]